MNILKNILLTTFIVGLFVYMGYIFNQQQIKMDELNNDIALCNRKIQEQYLESEKLTNTIASMSQDEYMEEVARERLGYVMPTEIIFMDASM